MTKVEKKIIEFLSAYPHKEFYGQEIVKKVKCSKASVSTLLKAMSKVGIVLCKQRGHMKFYQINPRSADVKKFKINSAIEELKPILPKLSKLSQKIILFGSASRGEQSYNSDLDLVVLSNEKNKIKKIIKSANSIWPLKAIIKTQSEWSEVEIKDPEFYREVKSGIILFEYVPRI
jgi:predicted nucleotidyltransferase